MHTCVRSIVLALAALLLAACERHSPPFHAPMPEPIRLSSPDPNFRLTESQRARVPANRYDADALERLLAEIRPGVRMEILEHFMVKGRPGRLVEFHDASLQPLLDAVWAPLWRNATDAEVDADIYGLPGRETTRARRAAERRKNAGPR